MLQNIQGLGVSFFVCGVVSRDVPALLLQVLPAVLVFCCCLADHLHPVPRCADEEPFSFTAEIRPNLHIESVGSTLLHGMEHKQVSWLHARMLCRACRCFQTRHDSLLAVLQTAKRVVGGSTAADASHSVDSWPA